MSASVAIGLGLSWFAAAATSLGWLMKSRGAHASARMRHRPHSQSGWAAYVALVLPRAWFRPDPRRWEGPQTMTRRTRDLPEPRRGELNRNLGSRQLPSAIDAQRPPRNATRCQ